MKMNQRMTNAALLSAATLFLITGCGGNGNASEQKATAAVTQPASTKAATAIPATTPSNQAGNGLKVKSVSDQFGNASFAVEHFNDPFNNLVSVWEEDGYLFFIWQYRDEINTISRTYMSVAHNGVWEIKEKLIHKTEVDGKVTDVPTVNGKELIFRQPQGDKTSLKFVTYNRLGEIEKTEEKSIAFNVDLSSIINTTKGRAFFDNKRVRFDKSVTLRLFSDLETPIELKDNFHLTDQNLQNYLYPQNGYFADLNNQKLYTSAVYQQGTGSTAIGVKQINTVSGEPLWDGAKEKEAPLGADFMMDAGKGNFYTFNSNTHELGYMDSQLTLKGSVQLPLDTMKPKNYNWQNRNRVAIFDAGSELHFYTIHEYQKMPALQQIIVTKPAK